MPSHSLEPVIVAIKTRLPARHETVFDAWVTPDIAKAFFFTTPTGEVVRYEMAPQTGGTFTITERRPKDDGQPGTHDVLHLGHYIEIARPDRLVFSFSVPQYSSEETVVALDFVSVSSGDCDLTLTHSLGSSETAHQYRDQTEKGWRTVLGRLEKALARRQG
ncbi:MAG: SRPBCC domain-containing protein [Pseudomonadota bacterium]